MRLSGNPRSSHSEKDPSRDQRLRSPARALLVIEEPLLADVVSLALAHGHYVLRVASTGHDAASAVADWSPHLIVLDMDIEGNETLKRFGRSALEGGRLPVIAVTRRGNLESRLSAFRQGVDDILTIPFSPEELAARAVAVMRRTYREAAVFSPLLRLGGLEIDILNRRVRAGETELHLTSIEQSLLYLLAANASRVLTRDEILDHLWGADYVAESNIVDRHIRNLRLKLQNHSGRTRYIVTVHGRGYRFLAHSPDSPDGVAMAAEAGPAVRMPRSAEMNKLHDIHPGVRP
jgi:two-component system OmpR family response regulator